MPVQHVNRKGQTYYLHRATARGGTPRYYFSTKSEGELADQIPSDYEVYENPNGQVYLRKVRLQLITEDEIAAVEHGMREFSKAKHFRVDVKGRIIRIYTPVQDIVRLTQALDLFPPGRTEELERQLENLITYEAELRFVLLDEEKRLFSAERYYYSGAGDWIPVGNPDRLGVLVQRYVRHLGQESFFDL